MKPGILIISHGSREPGWVSLVDNTVRRCRRWLSKFDVPLEAAFLELVEGRLIQDGIDRLEAQGVTDMLAIPLFISSGSTHVDEIGWALGAYPQCRSETDLTPFRLDVRLTYGRPIDDDPEIAEILGERAASLSSDPARETLLFIGHGSDKPEFREAWRRGLNGLASVVRERGGYADADFAMLRPDLAAEAASALRRRHPEAAVLAVPVFLSEGYFTRHVIPQRLAGLDCRYSGQALMPHPQVARWAARQASDWLHHVYGISDIERK
ncbi:sirohydrochlorin chelatase [Cohnella pontilimi]|uniref:sirohydrochlorin chelatase n=1 Tax=Cohnella pontilimi TaxID=2564100 RepID=UPI00319DAAEA